jgi:acylpyruvate hydrolase
MRIATVRHGNHTSAARVEDESFVLLPFGDVGELLASGPDWRDRAAAGGSVVDAEDARIEQLVTRPSKVVCVGANYHSHLQESGLDVPVFPALFAKFGDALTGPFDDIEVPAGGGTTDLATALGQAAQIPTNELPGSSDLVDWEVELVVVIGRTVRRADEAHAADAIAGYTVGNDVSVRDWQLRTSQWLQGKTWEGMSPVGPVMTTVDEVGLRPDLRIECRVDGEVVQADRTSAIVFDPVETVSYISKFVTLRPGDLVFTGSPAGVGISRTPPKYLGAGQVLTSEVEGIGTMVNRLVASREGDAVTDRARIGAER